MGGMEAVLSQRVGFVAGGGQQRIQPQARVIVEVFLTQGQPVQALGQELFHGMVHIRLRARIVEAPGQGSRQAQARIDLAQEQRAAIAGECPAGKIRDHFARTQVLKEQRLVLTLCRRRSGVEQFHWAE